ncbi:MAG: YidC/Oxa1 family membrane protein insertase [Oscillospiraceae bacterium]|nr:YidC/Oxa1 family membrane protein insertase [Oscillospiraceae bacterium]
MFDWLLTYLIGVPMQFICQLFQNYGIALFFFTLLTKFILMPLSIKQQKSMARMSAYQPLIQDIQKKWANDKNRQQQEMMKLYEDYNISPTMGCLPLLIQFPILMALYTVIRQPLKFILQMDATLYTNLTTAAAKLPAMESLVKSGYADSAVLRAFREGDQSIIGLITDPDTYHKIDTFSQQFNVFGINLTDVPQLALEWAILIPILSGVTMVLSSWIQQKASGQKMQGSMKIMNIVMSGMFVWMGFTVPTGLSLYWIYSNVLGLCVSLLLKRFYDPEKMKQQLMDEIEAKKKAKKAKKKIVMKDASGNVVQQDLSEAELARIRLEKARKLAEERYQEETRADSPEA